MASNSNPWPVAMWKPDEMVTLTGNLFAGLFVGSPLAQRIEELTDLQHELDRLRDAGHADPLSYFREHPDEVDRCAGLVRLLATNSAALKLYGADSDADLLRHLAQVPRARHASFQLMLSGLLEGRTHVSGEEHLLTLAGEAVSVRLDVTLLPSDPNGRHIAIVALNDISEQRRAELELRRSHDSQRTLNTLLGLALQDLALEDVLQRALVLVLENPWPATLGVGAVFLVDEAKGELVLNAHNGIDPQILDHCTRVPFGRCVCGRVAASRQPIYCGSIDERHEILYAGIRPHGHYCIPIAAGETLLGVLNVYLQTDHQFNPSELDFLGSFASTLAGIIARKRAEESLRLADEQLREQAALTRLGEMAAVVAHEVKNPLAAVRGAIQVIGGRLPPGGRDAEVVGEVVNRIDALDELMQDLLLFARPPQARPRLVDVVALAKETAALLREDPNAHGVRVEVEGLSVAVLADAKLLKIVLLNLFLNAAHAMHTKGTIRVSVASDEQTCRITVADAGPGIAPEMRERIFTPFFTTKARGSGLGLSTAKRLVDAHQGTIKVECPADGGTTVTIELPR